ncbi:MAG: hypothetical protein N2260_10490 [Syntrophobacterales bacterium]|nr:hypothetical protein [Syntrophobacterales bacterium]
MKIKKVAPWLVFIIRVLTVPSFAQDLGFNKEDRERLIRLEVALKVFMGKTDKGFAELREDMNKRFEQVDKRFEQMMTFLWILSGIFTSFAIAIIDFAYWDRRTIIKRLRIKP